MFRCLLLSLFLIAVPSVPACCAPGIGPSEGLHIVLLGDSNTWIGGDNCDNETGWSKWFRELLDPTFCRSYARSGATWTNTSSTKLNMEENIGVLGDDNVIYNQIERLLDDVKRGISPSPDIVIIGAGTNDAWFADKRPYAFSCSVSEAFADSDGFITDPLPSEVLSLAESVRYGCELVMESFPDALIILLTPFQTTKADPALIRKTGDIIEECGKRMSVPVVRQDYLSGIYSTREAISPCFTYDGTHTNPEGAKRVGRMIAGQVMQLIIP